MENRKVKKLTICSVFTALALILSYVESLVPTFFAIPGIKLGLANLVIIVALYILGTKEAILINLVRILLSSVLFGNGVGLAYSIAGAALSLLVMIFLKRSKKVSKITVSICGGVFHNIGQILVAVILVGNNGILWYLAILWVAGIVSGAMIGLLSGLVIKRIRIS